MTGNDCSKGKAPPPPPTTTTTTTTPKNHWKGFFCVSLHEHELNVLTLNGKRHEIDEKCKRQIMPSNIKRNFTFEICVSSLEYCTEHMCLMTSYNRQCRLIKVKGERERNSFHKHLETSYTAAHTEDSASLVTFLFNISECVQEKT